VTFDRKLVFDDVTGQVTHASCTNPDCACGHELQPRDAFSKAPGTRTGIDNQCKKCRGQRNYAQSNERREAAGHAPRRKNRTTEELAEIDAAMHAFAEEHHPVNTRQIYYQLVSTGLLEKSENSYKMVVHRSARMREDDRLPYEWITDHSRSVRLPSMFGGAGNGLRALAQQYRRDPWADQAHVVHIWLEKEALLDVFYPITEEYGVPLFPAKGYASVSFLKEAADQINAEDKPVYIYFWGDHDPSGEGARTNVKEKLEGHGCTLAGFEVVAVRPEQIESMDLLTRETKLEDPRAAAFIEKHKHIANGDSVDVDAIHPDLLRQMIREAIEQHIDRDAWAATLGTQEAEKATLEALAERVTEDGVSALEEFVSRD
jgi:hypothetical protein